MKNKDLAAFYDRVYKKGERKHYTSLRLSGDKAPPAKDAVLKEIAWRGKTVLDAGCGAGELAYLIAKKGAVHVFGIDFSSNAIQVAKTTYKAPNLEFIHTDIAEFSNLKILTGFDIICSLGTLEHVDRPLDALRKFKRMLNPGGSIIITCPNWINPRGYMLFMLKYLFDAKITLADIHYFTPLEFDMFAKKLSMNLSWRTVEQEWGHGEKCIRDFERRLPNVFRDLPVKVDQKRISSFLSWLESHMAAYEKDSRHGGAVGLYHLRKR